MAYIIEYLNILRLFHNINKTLFIILYNHYLNFGIRKQSVEVKVSNLINYSTVCCQNEKDITIIRNILGNIWGTCIGFHGAPPPMGPWRMVLKGSFSPWWCTLLWIFLSRGGYLSNSMCKTSIVMLISFIQQLNLFGISNQHIIC
jgi:hypothetical protein